jgi:hypothetical protein
MRMEARAKWKFATPGDGAWRWIAAHEDGSALESPSAFAWVEDCMADAARHGYADYRPTEPADS